MSDALEHQYLFFLSTFSFGSFSQRKRTHQNLLYKYNNWVRVLGKGGGEYYTEITNLCSASIVSVIFSFLVHLLSVECATVLFLDQVVH
jgi:hypothetical protein